MNWLLDFFGYPPIIYTSPATDKWLADDKVAHFIGHFCIGYAHTKWLHCPIGGGIFSACFGVQHELYDSAIGNGFSWKDIAANTAGWAFGTVLGLVI